MRVRLISDMVRAQRLRWAGHMVRREEESLVKAVALLQPAGTRPVSKTRKRWKDTIGDDMRMPALPRGLDGGSAGQREGGGETSWWWQRGVCIARDLQSE